MSSNTQVSTSCVNLQADLISSRLVSGYLDMYDGSQPATADTAITTQQLIATLRFSGSTPPSATNGTVILDLIPDIALQDGTVTWYRCYESNHTSVVMDGNIGTVDENMVLSMTTVLSGQLFNISNFQHIVRKQ